MNDREINMSEIGINSDINLNNEHDNNSNKVINKGNRESVFNSNHLSQIVFQDLSKQIDSIQEKKEEDEKCDNIIYYTLVTVSLGFIMSIGCWFIFSIIALCNTTNREIEDKCSNSNLWNLLLVLVLYTAVNSIISLQQNNSENENYKNIIIKLIMGTCFIVWCGIELFKKCAVNNLKNTSIYVLTEIYFWTSISITGMLLISNCITYYFTHKYK
jgi:cation transport ATPase